MSDHSDEELPKSVQRRIEKNRQRAIILKRSKLVAHPYAKGKVISTDTTTIKIGGTKFKDTGGGFLLEETDDKVEVPDKVVVQQEAAIIAPDRPICENCKKPFAISWLFDRFLFKCCDSCRDPETHKIITKTEAKNTYLLKDCDFDKREPPLKYITQKNPHHVQWGEMKLYLKIQVEKRALEVWGSEEELERERELREEKRVIAKSKKYEKKMKELRKDTRSTLFDRTTATTHTHEFGPETYNEEEDTYHHKCTTCPYEETFEKM